LGKLLQIVAACNYTLQSSMSICFIALLPKKGGLRILQGFSLPIIAGKSPRYHRGLYGEARAEMWLESKYRLESTYRLKSTYDVAAEPTGLRITSHTPLTINLPLQVLLIILLPSPSSKSPALPHHAGLGIVGLIGLGLGFYHVGLGLVHFQLGWLQVNRCLNKAAGS